MAVDRALLVDVLRPDQQDSANAWASLMVSVGQVVGYWTCVPFFLDSLLVELTW